ncbi:hypothetical protein TRICI_006480 [Trichomonascus ciferrii]|uniref:Major facilitator superfamily (MFS) profile domain-containing protein n=1 Tax=Trichomonascus ciferrii TaxID=44093 RepID=A0A642UH50_9ASCO|nr:hypothetical protein TRICI_006480 [Trichomonascus ciferrii]
MKDKGERNTSPVAIIGLLLTSVTSGYLIGVQNIVFFSDQWKQEFGDPTGVDLNLLATAVGLGSLGGLALEILATSKGQWRNFLVGSVFVLIGALKQGLSRDWWGFFKTRLACGFGNAIACNGALQLLDEATDGSQKELLTILYGGLWSLGMVLGNAVTHESADTWSWRIPSCYQAMIPALQLLTYFFMPKRWFLGVRERDPASLHPKDIPPEHIKHEANVLKSGLWHLVLAVFLPVICIHLGNGIVLVTIGEVLEFTYGITTIPQQIFINGILFLNSLVATLHKHFYNPSQIKLTLLSITTTSILIIGTIYILYPASIAVALLSLLAAGHIVLMAIPTTILTNRLPASVSPHITNVLSISTNLCLLYNGFINPWSMPRALWTKYSNSALIFFLHLVLIALFVLLHLPSRTLRSFPAINIRPTTKS